jgi:hypothetical protein
VLLTLELEVAGPLLQLTSSICSFFSNLGHPRERALAFESVDFIPGIVCVLRAHQQSTAVQLFGMLSLACVSSLLCSVLGWVGLLVVSFETSKATDASTVKAQLSLRFSPALSLL